MQYSELERTQKFGVVPEFYGALHRTSTVDTAVLGGCHVALLPNGLRIPFWQIDVREGYFFPFELYCIGYMAHIKFRKFE